MWIIPSNHSLHSAFAQECVASIEELNAQLQLYGTHTVLKTNKKGEITKTDVSNMPLMWRSMPLSPGIWLRKWSKVYWLPLLFSRTLQNSHGNNFTEKYTSSLEDILVNHFHKPGYRTELRTEDI